MFPQMGKPKIGQLLAARVLAQQLHEGKDLPEEAIKRGSVQAKAVALALKECAISTPGFDDQEKAFTLYTSLRTFLDTHYEDLLIAEFDQLTVEHVMEVGGDKDTVAELLHALDF